jgi:hypothetical protein
MSPTSPITPIFRWTGQYFGYLRNNQLHDRYGHHVGWVEGRGGEPPEVYALSGVFLGELVDDHYVMHQMLHAEREHRDARPPVPDRLPPDVLPGREPRDPRDGWSDPLPWPLPPPDPPSR